MTEPAWKEVLPSPCPGGRLEEAWMTTFEPPDSGLLVEHLLPSLLSMNNSLSNDFKERNLFFGELGTSLEVMRNRLTVISSPPRDARENAQYPWLWRYVSHFIVGAKAQAIQHSKLWAFHWTSDVGESLELYVSSTNLTTASFKRQLQAGWQLKLPLGKRGSKNARRTWGELIPFLKALGASAGTIAAERIHRLVVLLARTECPSGVQFVASVPGGRSAARQLAGLEPSRIHVFTPTVGEWKEQTLAAWSADIGIETKKIHLKWISNVHPWASGSGWALSESAITNLQHNGVQMDCLPKKMQLTNQHRDGDPRWSHAKLYLLRSRRRQWLLVTSANWSVSAWGSGRISPRNFELGVIFESNWRGLEEGCEPFDPPDSIPFCIDQANEEKRISSLEWAEASWDGRRIVLRARSTDSHTPINASVSFAGGTAEQALLVEREVSIAWDDAARVPLVARFTQETQSLEVDIVDLRPPSEFEKTPLPEVDPAVERALREAFLLQRYGGPFVDPESIPGLRGDSLLSGHPATAADYSVQVWIETRAAFNVVDQWRTALEAAAGDAQRIERVRMDGKALQSLFSRRKGPGAALVAEELGWRLHEDE